jgi:hypothetical protein
VTVSLFRLYLLRLAYLILVVGIGVEFWPGLLLRGATWPLMQGVAFSMLAALSVLAVIGLRYPLALLPALFFELLWKTLWLVLVALPKWWAGPLDAATRESVFACAMAVILLPLIPWRYVVATYVMKPGERWR